MIFDACQQNVMPAPLWGLEIMPSSAEVLARFRKPLYDQYKPIPALITPSIVLNEYGKGRSIYLAGNFGEHFRVYGIADHMRMLGNALRWLSRPLVKVQDMPETVEVVLRRQKNKRRLMVHLVNFTGTMRRPISKVVPVVGSVIDIPLEELRAAGIDGLESVRMLKSGESIKAEVNAESALIRVPQFEEYEVLVLESGNF